MASSTHAVTKIFAISKWKEISVGSITKRYSQLHALWILFASYFDLRKNPPQKKKKKRKEKRNQQKPTAKKKQNNKTKQNQTKTKQQKTHKCDCTKISFSRILREAWISYK